MSATRPDVYQIITDRVLSLIDAGVAPWRKGWVQAAHQWPSNLCSKKHYRGVNTILLGCTQYSAPYWLTYRQALAKGGHVRKGEKSSMAVFWKLLDRKTAAQQGEAAPDAGQRKIPLLRFYAVFNVEQCEGIEYPKPPPREGPTPDPIAAAQAIIDAMPNRPHMNAAAGRAYYSPGLDMVNVPALDQFQSAAEYYSTVYHELTHSTMHGSRLDRKPPEYDENGPKVFGSENYGKEELVAEMGAAFLCGVAGIEDQTLDNSAAYLDNWRKAIKADPKLIVMAAAQAQKAVDYIAPQPAAVEEEAQEEETP